MTTRIGRERDPSTRREQSTYPVTARREPKQARRGFGPDTQGGHGRHGGHRLMMMICCVPMLLIAVTLVATGVAGSGIVAAAVLCTAMMAAMMFMMPGGHDHK